MEVSLTSGVLAACSESAFPSQMPMSRRVEEKSKKESFSQATAASQSRRATNTTMRPQLTLRQPELVRMTSLSRSLTAWAGKFHRKISPSFQTTLPLSTPSKWAPKERAPRWAAASQKALQRSLRCWRQCSSSTTNSAYLPRSSSRTKCSMTFVLRGWNVEHHTKSIYYAMVWTRSTTLPTKIIFVKAYKTTLFWSSLKCSKYDFYI